MKENEKKFGVFLNCKTRNDKLNGIYDYSSKDVIYVNYFLELKSTYILEIKNKNIIICEKNFNIAIKKGDILFTIFIKKVDESDKVICKIKVDYKGPKDYLKETINWDKCLWYVINSDVEIMEKIDNNEYILGENDILKIGNYKYVISKIHLKDKKIIEKEKFCDFSPPLKKVKKCEFCGEIMVQLCNCPEYYHINEIKNWIKERYRHVKKDKSNTNNYYFPIPHCEPKKKEGSNSQTTGCNFYYPLNFKYNPKDLIEKGKDDSQNEELDANQEGKSNKENKEEQVVNFFDFEIPQDKDYMILESFPEKDKNQNSNNILKSVHIIELTGLDTKIGRNEKNDIILEDKAVSYEHAVIKYDKKSGNLTIKNLSKHAGTLALIHPKNTDLLELNEKSFFFQANKSLLEAKVMNLSTFLKNYKNINSDYPKIYEEPPKEEDNKDNKK